MTSEKLLADIRNKLGNIATLISLLDRKRSPDVSKKEIDYIDSRIDDMIIKSKESIEYIKKLNPHNMKKAYIVKLLDGGGDTTLKLVDEETWNWIMLNDPGKPKNNTTIKKRFLRKDLVIENNQWEDQLCPDSILSRIKKEMMDNNYKLLLSGTYQNDRAIYAPRLLDDYDFESNYCSTVCLLEMIEKAKSMGYTVDIENEYFGYMY